MIRDDANDDDGLRSIKKYNNKFLINKLSVIGLKIKLFMMYISRYDQGYSYPVLFTLF